MSEPFQKRKNVKLGVFLGTTAVVVLMFSVLWSVSILGKAPSELEHELKLAKADGMMLEPDDLRRSVAVDENQNANFQLRMALDVLDKWKKSPEGKAVSKLTDHANGLSSLTPEQIQQVGPAVSKLDRFYSLLHAATQKQRLDFHRAWGTWPSLLFPELSEERAAGTVTIAKAKYDLSQGRTAEALDSIDMVARLSNLTGQDPVIIGLLVQCAIRSQAYEVLGDVVKAHSGDAAILQRCREILKDMGPQPDLLRTIRSEFVLGRQAVKGLGTQHGAQDWGSENNNGVIRLSRYGPFRTAYELRYTQLYRTMYEGLSKKPDSIIAMQNVLNQAQVSLQNNAGHDWSYGLADMLSPVFTGTPAIIGESEARRNVLLSAIDLLDERRKTGHIPQSLPGNSGHWLDPFTERPLAYHPSKDGFLIYSFARNGKDDGGKARSKRSSDDAFDIPFSFP